MRQSSLIAALAILVLLGAAAAWFFLRPDGSAGMNAADNSVALAPDLDSNPLQFANEDRRLPINAPERQPPDTTDPDGTQQPGEGKWLVRGRIEVTAELEALAPKAHAWSNEVYVYFLADNKQPDETASLYFELKENRAFSDIFLESDLGLEEGAPLPPGTWQVLYADEGSTSDSLFNLDDGALLADLQGIIKPRITGRIIDFGAVTIGIDEYFYHKVFLTGRLVHSSGRALAYSGPHSIAGTLRDEDGTEWEMYADFTTLADGTFSVTAWNPGNLDKLAGYQWRIHRSGEWWDDEEVDSDAMLPPPAWKGRQAHFGDITLAGALVEIVVTGEFETKLDADGNLAFDSWGEYEGEYVDVSFESSNSYYSARGFPQPHTTLLVVEEGRYVWSAFAYANAFYPQFSGVLLARHGQAYRIELDFKPYPSIPLVVTLGEDTISPDTCVVNWYVMRGEKQVGSGNFYYAEGSRVPLDAGGQTNVYVSYPGYNDAEATATPGMAQLAVAMQKDDRPTATLVVVVPAQPKVVDATSLGAALYVVMPEQSESVVPTWGEASVEQRFTIHSFGRGTVRLQGGLNWGYPNGIMSGPVEFEIAQGEVKRIELPAIADPPWSKRVTSIKVEARSSGCPVNLVASLRYADMPKPINDTLTHGGSLSVRGVPQALTDGREDYPIVFTPGQDGSATLAIDLPHTIEVRLIRGGKPMEAFSVWASSTPNEAPDLSVQCEGFAVEGVARLWIPRGLVNLDMRIDGSSVSSVQVEVTPGQVLQVEGGSELLRLEIELEDESYDPYNSDFDGPELWMMQSCDAEGEWSDFASVSYPLSMMLGAGKYRMVPWNGGDNFEFEMTDQDKTVRLPEITAPTFGTVILKFDVASLGDAYADAEFYYEFIDKLQPPAQWSDEHWVSETLVPDGFKLNGLPAGVELALGGRVWVSAGEEEYELLMLPLTVRVTKETQLVEAVIKRAIALDEEWYNIDARMITQVEHLYRPVNESAIPGRYEVAIYVDEELQFRDWVTFPETSIEPFKIPDGLRRELESRELISPIEDE